MSSNFSAFYLIMRVNTLIFNKLVLGILDFMFYKTF